MSWKELIQAVVSIFAVILMVIFLVICPLLALVTDISYDAWPATEGVSSFYGPGAFLAWLLGAFFVLYAYLRKVERSGAHSIGRTVTFGYAAFAAGDAFLRTCQGARIGDSAQLGAALTVCRYALLLSLGAGFGGLEEDVAPSWWTALSFFVVGPLVLSELLVCSAPLPWYRALVALTVAVCSLFGKMMLMMAMVGFGFSTLSLYIAFLRAVVLKVEGGDISPSTLRLCHSADGFQQQLLWTLAWPKSGVAWSEMDQVAALAAAVGSLLLAVLNSSDRWSQLLNRWS